MTPLPVSLTVFFCCRKFFFSFFLSAFLASAFTQPTFTQQDRERIIRLEVKQEEMSKRFEQRFEQFEKRLDKMDERFDKMDERFDRMDERFDTQLNILLSAMGILLTGMIALAGYILWDRRTSMIPLEARVKQIEQVQDIHFSSLSANQTKLKSLVETLQTLGKKDPEVITILKQFNLI